MEWQPIHNRIHGTMLRLGIALLLLGSLLIAAAPRSPAAAEGPLQGAEICGGQCVYEMITFETGDLRIDRIDVVFLIDASGSMGDEIDEVQEKSVEIMDTLRALVPDSAFGVASFVDYNGFEDPTYGELYGSDQDYPYRMEQDVTEDTTAVQAALDSITLEYGEDTPESYSRALWEMQFLNWRKDTKRIVIMFGDAYPHDRTFFSTDYGVDPGRDERAGTDDDLVFVEVVQDLVDERISVIGVNSGYDSDNATEFFEYVADETGGLYFPLRDADEIPDAVARLIEEEISTIDRLTVRTPEAYGDWITSSPDMHTDVGSNATVEFEVDICPLDGRAKAGTYEFELILDGDGVVLETIPISIDYDPRCTTGPEIFIADNEGDDGAVCSEGPFWVSNDIINRNQDDDVYYHQNPIRGQANYLYARAHNIGTRDARQVEVTFYWADAGIGLRWPGDWRKIDSTTIDVPVGESVWTDGVAWDPPSGAGDNHFCILVTLDSDEDPLRRPHDVSCDNNVAQRNLQLLDLDPDDAAPSDDVSVVIVAPPADQMGVIDIVIIIPDAPAGTEIRIIMPSEVFARWEAGGGEVDGGRVEGDYIVADPEEAETIIRDLPLEAGENVQVELKVDAPVESDTEPFSITIVERVDGQDWGGNTYYYAPPPPPSFPTDLTQLGDLIQNNLVWVGAGLGCCGLSIIGIAVLAIGASLMRRR